METMAAYIIGFLSAFGLLFALWLVVKVMRKGPAPKACGESESVAADSKLLHLGTLAGGLAHEIKNPLSTLSVNLQLLREDWEKTDSPASKRILAKLAALQNETKRLEDILNDFLRFARRDELELEKADINRLLEEIIDFTKPQLLQKGIEILTYFEPSIPDTLLDVRLMKQALLNVFINAREAAPEGAQIIVKTSGVKEGFRIEIIDTGRGIPPDIREKVFDVYFSTKKGGTGLGLPTAARIIQQHGGRISFQSEPGKGTNFIIDIPFDRGPRD